MMIYIIALSGIILSFLLGSINFAIPICRIVKKVDIRTLGNNNPGSSNVARSVGPGWGILTGFLDGAKGVVPIILYYIFFFREYINFNWAVLYLMGIVAVIGHCKSIFLKFKGGGGIATMTAVSLFFIPVEFFASIILSGIIILVFFPRVEKKFGQKIPTCFTILTPFITLLLSLLLDIPLFLHFRIGQLPATVAGSFAMSLTLLWINSSFLKTKIRET